MNRIELSVVVPLFNEEDSVQLLHKAVTDVLVQAGIDYEILFIDDGSEDNTLQVANALTLTDNRLRVVEFRANYGQTPAMAAGIDLARGEVIATMDGDLQNDPADIPSMLAEMDEHTDLVVGWRKNRQDKLVTRKIPSWIANRLIGMVTGVPIRDNGCSLKLYRASVIKQVPLYAEMHRFIPAMASITGARVREVPVTHHARQFGSSKYGLSRVYKVLLDLVSIKTLIGFAQRPLLWFGLLSLPFIAVSMISVAMSVAPLFSPDGQLVLPLAGVGVLCGSLAVFLVMGGAAAELVYATGDLDLAGNARLLASRKRRSGLVSTSRGTGLKAESVKQ